MINAVIFDMDGLMFDTEALAKTAWLQVGEQLGYPITETQIAQIRGSTPAASAEIFRSAFGPDFDYPTAKALRNAMVEDFIDQNGVPIKYGLVCLLERLRQHGFRTAVASSSPRKTIEKYLSMTGLRAYYDGIVSAEDASRSKPAPDVFLLAAERLGVPAENCLVLEDSANGLQAANCAGMVCVCIPDIAPPEHKILSLAAAVFPDLSFVYNWITERNGLPF
ncbi:MAG: HAD family hydrolase [Faecousia sp.]